MAHEISHVSGKSETFHVGETPWHGLGQKLENVATAQEAIEAAGLGWDVELKPVMAQMGLQSVQVEGLMATVRMDANLPLAVVSDRYEVIQNSEAFEFFDAVVGTDEAMYHTAGALGRGERIWMLAKLPGSVKLVNDHEDVVEKYLLLHTGHDGKTCMKAQWTPVRVVCNNTLAMAVSGKDARSGVTVRHLGDVKSHVVEAQHILGIVVKQYETFEQKANWLSGIEMTEVLVKPYIEKMFPMKDDITDRQRNKVTVIRGTVRNMFENERGRTAWHLANAVAEYADHERTFKRGRVMSAKENRFKSVLMGQSAQLKARAFDLIDVVAEKGCVV